MEQVESHAANLAERLQAEPTPGEIMARFHALAKRWQPKRHGEDLVMYAKITAHPILAAAITNALHSRWGHPHNPRALALAGAAPVSARLLMKALFSRS